MRKEQENIIRANIARLYHTNYGNNESEGEITLKAEDGLIPLSRVNDILTSSSPRDLVDEIADDSLSEEEEKMIDRVTEEVLAKDECKNLTEEEVHTFIRDNYHCIYTDEDANPTVDVIISLGKDGGNRQKGDTEIKVKTDLNTLLAILDEQARPDGAESFLRMTDGTIIETTDSRGKVKRDITEREMSVPVGQIYDIVDVRPDTPHSNTCLGLFREVGITTKLSDTEIRTDDNRFIRSENFCAVIDRKKYDNAVKRISDKSTLHLRKAPTPTGGNLSVRLSGSRRPEKGMKIHGDLIWINSAPTERHMVMAYSTLKNSGKDTVRMAPSVHDESEDCLKLLRRTLDRKEDIKASDIEELMDELKPMTDDTRTDLRCVRRNKVSMSDENYVSLKNGRTVAGKGPDGNIVVLWDEDSAIMISYGTHGAQIRQPWQDKEVRREREEKVARHVLSREREIIRKEKAEIIISDPSMEINRKGEFTVERSHRICGENFDRTDMGEWFDDSMAHTSDNLRNFLCKECIDHTKEQLLSDPETLLIKDTVYLKADNELEGIDVSSDQKYLTLSFCLTKNEETIAKEPKTAGDILINAETGHISILTDKAAEEVMQWSRRKTPLQKETEKAHHTRKQRRGMGI